MLAYVCAAAGGEKISQNEEDVPMAAGIPKQMSFGKQTMDERSTSGEAKL